MILLEDNRGGGKLGGTDPNFNYLEVTPIHRQQKKKNKLRVPKTKTLQPSTGNNQ